MMSLSWRTAFFVQYFRVFLIEDTLLVTTRSDMIWGDSWIEATVGQHIQSHAYVF
jgi:hypothetical protein